MCYAGSGLIQQMVPLGGAEGEIHQHTRVGAPWLALHDAQSHQLASAAAAASQEKLPGARCQVAIKPWMLARIMGA